MKYTRGQFAKEYYRLWEVGFLLPVPSNASFFSVKYRKNHLDQYSRVTLRAVSVSDALERACYAVTYGSPWRPEDIDLHAVYDNEENLLWIDESFYDFVQKRNEFRGMERRDFLAKFGATSAAILFGLRPEWARAGQTTVSMAGTASGFSGEQLYTTAGSYSWTVPASITSCCVVCVGGGGGAKQYSGSPYGGSGGGGGALAYINNYAVNAGNTFTVFVGGGGASDGTNDGVSATLGGASYFSSIGTVGAGGGNPGDLTNGGIGGTVLSGTGGAGGMGGARAGVNRWGFGGGAGGYSGNGGNGGQWSGTLGNVVGTVGAGGAGGGANDSANRGWNQRCGVGLLGSGTSGNAGQGGSGGSSSTGEYGGGASTNGSSPSNPSPGGSGAVRIIWGPGRSFPSNAS